jgi:hypothetical protein
MTASEQGALALRMGDDVRRIATEGIRQRHPVYSEHEVRRALLALLYGADPAASLAPVARAAALSRSSHGSQRPSRAGGFPICWPARSPARLVRRRTSTSWSTRRSSPSIAS